MATVRDILSRKGATVVTMVAEESVLNAARLMNERGIGGVVVTADRSIVGVFTERDVLRRVVAEQRDPARTPLRDVMTTEVVTCRPDAELGTLSSLMTERRIRHIPVVSDEGPCGMVTSGDIMAYQAREHEYTIQQLNNYVHDMR